MRRLCCCSSSHLCFSAFYLNVSRSSMSLSGNTVAALVSTSCAPTSVLTLQVKRRVEAKNGLENYAFQVRNSLRDDKVSTAACFVGVPQSYATR